MARHTKPAGGAGAAIWGSAPREFAQENAGKLGDREREAPPSPAPTAQGVGLFKWEALPLWGDNRTQSAPAGPVEDVEQRKALLRITAAYREGSLRGSLLQLLLTLGPLALFYTLGMWSVRTSWALALVWAVPTAAFVVRAFILQHDSGHGSLFKSKRLNDITGFLLGILTLTPYQCWRRFHAQHHADFGNLERRGFGDILTLTRREYLALSPSRRLLYRLYRSPLVLLVLGPVFLFVIRQRLTYNLPRAWRRERASVHLTNLVLLGLLAAITWAGALESFLKFHLPMMALASSAGVWLFYVQHQFADTCWRRAGEWSFVESSLRGSSYYELPHWLRWLTGNIGIHHIHHLDARVPGYRLYACMRDNPELRQCTALSLGASLRCMQLKLWDEDRRSMISFREA